MIESSQKALKISFTRLFATNVDYRPFGQLLEGLPLRPQISCIFGSVIIAYYDQYSKLLEGLDNKSIVDVDQITRDIEEDNLLEGDNTSRDDKNEAASSNGNHGRD